MRTESTNGVVAEGYLEILGGGEMARHALLACAAALRLDDEAARQAIALVAGSNGSTDELLRQIKDLGCVARRWDGTWYVADDVRPYLVDRLWQEVPAGQRDGLRDLLAGQADARLSTLAPDGQITTWRARATSLEAAYQRLLSSRQATEGASQLVATWQKARGEAQAATAEAVEALAPELERHLECLPDEVLFLRGMAAYGRRQWKRARQYFETVWRHGPGSEIHAIAAHLFGKGERDWATAEAALRDSIAWNSVPRHRAQVWHSLGKLLARQRPRWREAEDAYQKSLKLDPSPAGKAQVWHSFGNLLTRQWPRWREAEDAYQKSLKLDPSPAGKAQVWHSFGNLLARQRPRWREAEDAYQKSLELDPGPIHKAQVWHSFGNLLARQRPRWREAEDAYQKSLKLDHDPHHRGQVLASWADALHKRQRPEDLELVVRYALQARELDPKTPKTRGVASRVLAEVYERQGKLDQALRAYEELLATNKQLRLVRFIRLTEDKIEILRRRMR